jgi:hypothetical protein
MNVMIHSPSEITGAVRFSIFSSPQGMDGRRFPVRTIAPVRRPRPEFPFRTKTARQCAARRLRMQPDGDAGPRES